MIAVLLLLALISYALVYSGLDNLKGGSLSTWDALTGRAPSGTISSGALAGIGSAAAGAATGGPRAVAVGADTPAIKQIRRATRKRFPAVVSFGTYSCRRIWGSRDPSDPWSQHAFGNAWDLQPSERIARWLLAEAKAGRLPVAQILWKGRDLLSGHAVEGHRDHIHVSGSPMYSGTPPCASPSKPPRGGGRA